MSRFKLLALSLCAVTVAGVATMQLAAQPEPYRPISTTDALYELVLPPGTYQSLVIAFEGGANTKTAKATLKAPSGDMLLLIGAGETLIVPLSTAGWTISQPVSIKLTQPTTQLSISATSAAGPIKLEPPAKK